MKKKNRLLSGMAFIISVAVIVPLPGWNNNATAEVFTIDQLNEMRAAVNLPPLSGELSTDLPMLQGECDQGIEDSCILKDAVIDSVMPSQPGNQEIPEQPGTRGAPDGPEVQVKI